jgi:branched-chain amino acid transport system permease protein
MLSCLLSNDFPRNRVLAVVLVRCSSRWPSRRSWCPGVKALNVAAKVLVFVVLVASFDLLLGYTGIVSFAHTMFFGIGAYGVAIAATRMGPGWGALGLGMAGALALSFVLALASACSRCGCARSSSR